MAVPAGEAVAVGEGADQTSSSWIVPSAVPALARGRSKSCGPSPPARVSSPAAHNRSSSAVVLALRALDVTCPVPRPEIATSTRPLMRPGRGSRRPRDGRSPSSARRCTRRRGRPGAGRASPMNRMRGRAPGSVPCVSSFSVPAKFDSCESPSLWRRGRNGRDRRRFATQPDHRGVTPQHHGARGRRGNMNKTIGGQGVAGCGGARVRAMARTARPFGRAVQAGASVGSCGETLAAASAGPFRRQRLTGSCRRKTPRDRTSPGRGCRCRPRHPAHLPTGSE